MKNKRTVTMVSVATLVGALGCAQPPTAEIDAAYAALDAARSAEAGEYAGQALTAAQDAVTRLDEEVKLQDEKFVPMRNYDVTKTLASEAVAQAQKAQAGAGEEKQRLQTEATNLLEQTRIAVAEVRTMLEAAPKGKGSGPDLAMLATDLSGAESALSDVETALGAGQLRDALAKAETAFGTVAEVREAVVQAQAMAKGPRRG